MPFREKVGFTCECIPSLTVSSPTLSQCSQWSAVIPTSAQSFSKLPRVKPCKKLHEAVNEVNVLLTKPEQLLTYFLLGNSKKKVDANVKNDYLFRLDQARSGESGPR